MKPFRVQSRVKVVSPEPIVKRTAPTLVPSSPETIRTLGEYERILSRFETCGDGFILPDLHLIVRLDAHRHGGEWHDFEDSGYPFAREFVEGLSATARHLMQCGFRVVYAYVHGDEISVLLDVSETSNPRRRCRLVSAFASAAAVEFYRVFKRAALFHAKLSELPTSGHVVDYFMWQRKIAGRNYFSRTVGLALSAKGLTSKEIDGKLSGASEEDRTVIAAELGIVPTSYERWGLGLWWERDTSDQPVLRVSEDLSTNDIEYARFIRRKVEERH
jgi:tRNA(His) guanylyltransferase